MSESPLGFLLERFREVPDQTATVLGGVRSSYGELLAGIGRWKERLTDAGIGAGSVVLLKGDFTADTIACLLALLDERAIVIPVARASVEKSEEFAEVGEAEQLIDLLDGAGIRQTGVTASHEHYLTLRGQQSPGIVLFSSGTTGQSKGTVHNADRLLRKFHARRKDLRTLAFLLFDHIGGLDTLFYCLSNTSALVFAESRDPDAICALIEKHQVEVLPTAPSFLNLLLLSGAHERHDLSSLKIITYGAEMMPQSTLERCADAFPGVRLMQKYGTSEVGTMRSSSRDNRSRWVRIGGEGYAWRVRDGKLEIKSQMAMLGYLNAPSPFTEDGYFKTGDCVEVDGEYLRFSGRDSDIINVGGQKVFPAEVESLINQLPEVAEVAAFGQPHPMLGAVVCCKIRPRDPAMNAKDMRMKVRAHLRGQLERYKIPQKITLTNDELSTERFKQVRG